RAVLAAALLATAGMMWSHMPTKLQSWAPIQVHGTVGQRVTGRNLAVTVHSTYLAHEVTATGKLGLNRFPSKGMWLVMVLSYEPLRQPEKPRFTLQADGKTITTNLSGFGHLVQPEMPASGPLAFELPTVPHSATLLVVNARTDSGGFDMDSAPLDSQIAITMPLSGRVPRASLNLNELSHE
ncbi:MAG: hypothetical protein ACRDTV_02030, partial [Mycobacterium sp.]